MSDSLFHSYRIAFMGEYEEEETESPWTDLHKIGFVCFSLLLNVALANIFIGIMSVAYEDYRSKATVLFLRTRAILCLNQAILSETTMKIKRSAPLNDGFVWY